MKNRYLTKILQRNKLLAWLFGLLFLLPGISFAQIEYTFTNTTGTYEEVVPDQVLYDGPASVGGFDDDESADINIGFPFVYNGAVESNFRVSVNGFINFVSNGGIAYTGLSGGLGSTANLRIICSHHQDLHTYLTGVIGVKYLGTAPNRIAVIQWKNIQKFGQQGNFSMNFQIRLYETTNRIEVIYGPHTVLPAALNTTCQVGIRVGLPADFIALTTATSWDAAAPAAVNTATMPATAATIANNNLKYTFEPLPPVPNDLGITSLIEMPSGAVICDSTSLFPGIIVRNRGANTATPNVLVTVRQGTNVIATQAIVGSPITTNGFDTLYLSTPILLPTLGAYNVTVNLVGSDDLALNDTLRSTVTVNRNCSDLDYSVVQTNEAYSPITNGISVMALATGTSGVIDLPFSVPFAGTLYSQITAHRRGFVLFGNRTNFATNLQMAVNGTGTQNGAFIFAGNHTLRSVTAFKYEIRGTSPNREVVIEWDSLFATNPTGASRDTIFSQGQMIINERGRIRYHYGNNIYVGNSGYHVPVNVGVKLNDSTFQARESFLTINSWANTTEGKNIFSTVKTGVLSAPVPNGTVIDFLPPPPPTNDIGLLGFGAFPTLGTATLCDSVGVKPFVILANAGSNANTAFGIRMYVTNNITNSIIDSLDYTYSAVLDPFTIDTVIMPLYRMVNLGAYRFSFRVINAGDQVSFNNNLLNPTTYTVTRNCILPGYVFNRELSAYEAISTPGDPLILPGIDGLNQAINIPLPITFAFQRNRVGRVIINRHGYIVFRKSVTTTTDASVTNNVIGAAGVALDSSVVAFSAIQSGNASRTSRIDTATINVGTSRVFVIQWSNMDVSSNPLADSANLNYQIRLYEGTNRIEVIYGPSFYTGSARNVQTGLRLNNSSFYNNELFLDQADWLEAFRGYGNNSNVRVAEGIIPSDGLLLGYQPIIFNRDLGLNIPTFTVPTSMCANSVLTRVLTVNNTGTSAVVDGRLAARFIINATNTILTTDTVDIPTVMPGETQSFSFDLPTPPTAVTGMRIELSLLADDDNSNNNLFINNINTTACRNIPFTFLQDNSVYDELPTNVRSAALGAPSNDNTFINVNMPINFQFGGRFSNIARINPNGYVALRSSTLTAPEGSPFNGLTASSDSLIAAFAFDQILGADSATSNIRTGVLGNAPNRVFVVQWTNNRAWSTTNGARDSVRANYQVRMWENGPIQLSYGAFNGNFNTLVAPIVVQAGVRYRDTVHSFRTNSPVGPTSWNNTINRLALNSSLRYSNGSDRPENGLNYFYVPNGEIEDADKSVVALSSGTPCVGTALPIKGAITAAGFAPRQVGTVTYRIQSPSGAVATGSSDIQTYLIGGRTDTALVTNFTFTEAGSHQVIVRVNFVGDNNTTNDADTINIVVLAPTPTPTITASGATAICEGQSITLTAPEGASYLWSNGAVTRSITVSNAASYTVAYTSFTNPCLSLPSAPVVTTITPLVAGGFTTSANLLNVTVTNTAVNANSYSYTWDGGSSTSANPTITFAAPGTYRIRQIASSICGADTTDVNVTVNGPTDMTVAVNAVTTTGCLGSSLSYNGIITNTTNFNGLVTRVIYSVTTPSGVTTVDSVNLPSTPVVQGTPFILQPRVLGLTSPGTYVVGIAFRSSNDIAPANNFATLNFTAQPISTTPVITVVTGAICSGTPAVLSAPADAVSYLWSNGETTRTINITTPGAYTVQVTNANACISIPSASVSVANAVTPTAGFISSVSGRTVTVASTATGGGTISYFIDNGTTPVLTTGSGSFIPPVGTEEFDLVQIISNACGADTISERITSSNAILEAATKIYPNPTTGKLNVTFGALQFNNAVITLTDVTGKVIMTATSGSATELNLSNLPAAMYTLRVSVDGSAPAFFQVVKQ